MSNPAEPASGTPEPVQLETQPATDSSRPLRSLGSQEIPGELLRRVEDQATRLENMETIFKEADQNQGVVIYLDVVDSVEETQKIHEKFHLEHTYLIDHWPSSQFQHAYFTSNQLKFEESLFRKTMKTLRHLQQLLTPAGGTSVSAPQIVHSDSKPARLPEISIPKFDGDYLKWPEFKAMVEDLILNRKDISNTGKFHHLKGALKGAAAAVVTHLNPSEEALDGAWHLLIDRFENKRLIVNSHLERLYSMTPIKTRSSTNVTRIINTVNETLESLKVLQKGDISECLLTYHVTSLLDQDTREHWENSIGNSTEYPPIAKLIEFLSTRARTLEGLENSVGHHQKTPNFQAPKRVQSHSAAQAHSYAANHSRSEHNTTSAPSKWICDLCNGSHFITNCQRFRDMSVDQRVNVAREKVLCIYCLGRHSGRNCRNTNKKCRTCSYEHHTLLHGGNLRSIFERPAQTDRRSNDNPQSHQG